MCWNFAAAIDALSSSPIAQRPALLHADSAWSFAELGGRARAFAAWLQALGLPRGAHVGHYLRNSPAYIESFVGSGLAGLAHVNINYRYGDEELAELLRELDVRVLVYEQEFAARIERVRSELDGVAAFVEVGNGGEHAIFAERFDAILSGGGAAHITPACSGNDLVLVATGGTTGLPKGTMWRQEDLWRKLNVCRGGALQTLGLRDHPATLAEHIDNIARVEPPAPFMVLSPLMHGAGLMMALLVLAQGGALVTLPGTRFDAHAALDAIRAHGVGGIALVGDAFALPLLEALEARANEKPVESLGAIVSTGAALSADVKAGLRRHNPGLQIMDTLGSSEASGFALSTPEPGVFLPFPGTRVLDDRLCDVVPGSETPGMIYASGHLPVGYYKDPVRSAATFPEIDGSRYVRTGDRARVREDGMLVLLGRDSTVINTGGEKVWTGEVERVLLDHPAIRDALVIGLPHPRFGKQVIAVVDCAALAAGTLDEETIKAHAGAHLADYKVPRRVLAAAFPMRVANGKPDYPAVEAWADSQLRREEKKPG